MTPFFSFQATNFQEKDAAAADLKMVVSNQGVTLCITRGSDLLALKSWHLSASDPLSSQPEAGLGALLGGEKWLGWNFSTKSCAFSTSEVTLVPKRLFNASDLVPYFTLLLTEVKKYQLGHAPVSSIDGHLVWAVNKEVYRLIGHYFAPTQCLHLAEALINTLTQKSPADNYGVFCNIRGQELQILVFDRGQLAFYNFFQFSKPSDLLYYILLAFKQFDLNPLQTTLHISGAVAEDSEIYRLLLRYFRTIEMLKPASGMIIPPEAQSLPVHFWFDVSTI